MRELTLSKGFCRNWMERVGNYPTIEAVRHYIGQSIRVQEGLTLMTGAGQVHRVMALYWCTALEIIIAVDSAINMAMTVYSRDMIDRPKGRQPRRKPAPKATRKRAENVLSIFDRGSAPANSPSMAKRAAAVAIAFGARR